MAKETKAPAKTKTVDEEEIPKEIYDSSLPYAIMQAGKTFMANVRFMKSDQAKLNRLNADVKDLRAELASRTSKGDLKQAILEQEAEKKRLLEELKKG